MVDWYWQSHSAARHPATPLLLERSPLATGAAADHPKFELVLSQAQDAVNCASLAATMITVAAKGRFRTGAIDLGVLEFIRSLIKTLQSTEGLIRNLVSLV